MASNLPGDTQFYSVQHERFVMILIERFPSDIGLKLKNQIRPGNNQRVFNSIIIPLGCYPVFKTDLV
jgi:hypothetical protein